MKIVYYIVIFLFLQSCASAYHPIVPKKVKHNMHDTKDNLSLSYKYDVIGENGNTKYIKRAKRKGYQIVAYKVTNNTKDTLVMGKDVIFQSNNQQILLSNELVSTKSVKQHGIGYLLYMSMSWIFLYTNAQKDINTGNIVSYDKAVPIGFLVGLPITIGNIVAANFANRSFYDNLKYYDMNGKTLLPHESIDGLLVFKNKEQVLLQIGNTKTK